MFCAKDEKHSLLATLWLSPISTSLWKTLWK
jgi:hypothetical protein